jgi:hypothetical protein
MQFSRLQPRKLLIAEAVAAVIALSACGGGGSEITEDQASTVAESASESSADAAPPESTDATQAGGVNAEVTSNEASDPIASGVAPTPEPQPGESGYGSMEAQSQTIEELQLAQGSTDEPASPVETADQVDVAQEASSDEAAAGDTTTEAASESSESTDSERESAQYLTNIAGKSGYAKPKVAALDYSSNITDDRKRLLSKFNFVILSRTGSTKLASFTSGIKSLNSNTRIAHYVAFNELKCSASSGTYYYPLISEANKVDFWLRKASGTRSQWSTVYNACDMNLSGWGKKNSAGQTWMRYKANFDYNRIFKVAPAIDYAFSDNTFGLPRVDADWKRIRTNQLRTASDIIVNQRQGQAAYWSALRSLKPGIKIVGNADNDLSSYEYKGKLNGAFLEAGMGKSWSLETWAGWDKMMQRYRGQLRNSADPKHVFLEVRGDPSNFKLMRYGLASALLENGWFVYLPITGTFQPTWYDEYEAPLGTPAEPPPTAPKSNGIWMRKYTNGIVLVNPSKTTTKSIYVGTAYKRLKGTQNPSVNSGVYQSTVTLAPRSGLLMIKR